MVLARLLSPSSLIFIGGLYLLRRLATIRTKSPSMYGMWLFGTTRSRNFNFFNRPLTTSTTQCTLVTHFDKLASKVVCCFRLCNVREHVVKVGRNRLNFDDSDLNDDDLQTLIGLTTSDFDNLVKSVHSLLSTKLRSSRNAICILLFQLRTGLSNAVIATLCAFKNKRVVSHINKSTQLALLRDFVPENIGFNHITREEVVENHTTDISKQLFSDPISNRVILVLDGTFIFAHLSHPVYHQR